ncbi:MAG: polyprenyl synthetase family protein [Pseudomonadota bacterium]
MAAPAAAATPPAPPQDAVADAYALIADDMARVNAAIMAKMHSPVALIPQLAGHIVAAGGKRVRPMLTLLAARLVGYQGGRHIELAACVEFIHTATLLHDDVVDESVVRRGLDSANAVWGNKASVLVGDFLFSRAFQLMVGDGSLKVLEILSDASATIAEGEVLQLTTANDIETDVAAHLAVVEAKTAKLFAAASRIGAVVADRPDDEETALEAFGRNLGMAFQIADDVMDYASEARLGKAVGDDFRDGKITMPVAIALADADDKERDFWRRTLEEQVIRDGDLQTAMDILRQRDAIGRALAEAQRYAAAASAALDVFPDGDARRAMTALAAFSVARAA